MNNQSLAGKKALVVGIANKESIAYGCARSLKSAGAHLAITYLNEKSKPFLDPIAAQLKPDIYTNCDVTQEEELKAVFSEIQSNWGKLDILVHSIAFAPKEDLHCPITACSKEGFLLAMDVSCHSFLRMAHFAEPLMQQGGSLFTMSFYGAEKVVEHYDVMGCVKAALEAAVRYMAAELGPKKIRVIGISPGPVQTRAASGLLKFEDLLTLAKEKSPLRSLVDISDIGALLTFLASDSAKNMTGDIIYVDAGYHIIG
jgi:enoyl-[acyl-carrier protein] reductase I